MRNRAKMTKILAASLNLALAAHGESGKKTRQRLLAEKLGVTPASVSNWTRDGKIPPERINQAATILGYSTSGFIALGEKAMERVENKCVAL